MLNPGSFQSLIKIIATIIKTEIYGVLVVDTDAKNSRFTAELLGEK